MKYEVCRNCIYRCRCCSSRFFDNTPSCSGCENHYDEFRPAKHIKKCPLTGTDIVNMEKSMTEEEILEWLERWQMLQHCTQEEGDSDSLMALGIEQILLKKAGLDMENDWYQILRSRGLILDVSQ